MGLRTPELRNQIVYETLLRERVEKGPHVARFFLWLAKELNLNLYDVANTGAPPYCRITLMACIFHSMYHSFFEATRVVRFSKDSIGAHWILNGMAMPSVKTIERTIADLLIEIESFFIQVLQLCDSFGLIGRERTFTDGTKKQANASKHKAMSYEYLIKKIANGKEALKVLFAELRSIMDGIEELTDDEFEALVMKDAKDAHSEFRRSHKQDLAERQNNIFNIDSKAEPPKNKETTAERLKGKLASVRNIEPENQDKAVEMLNDVAFISKRVNRMVDAKATLETKWKEKHGNAKIPNEKQINFTDPDSAIMQTKHHGVQQCYNHLVMVDDKANIILGTHSCNSSSDQLGLIPLIENTQRRFGSLKGIPLGGDAGFFSAANIAYCIDKGIDFYASFPEAKSPFAKDKFCYDALTDTYTCPRGNILYLQWQSGDMNNRKYCNEGACRSCPDQKDCAKAKDGIRKIERDMTDDKLREDAKLKAQSELGKDILKQRKSVPEPVWGNMITQDGYTQSHFRGEEKAGYEFDLHSAIQNIRKLLKVYLNSSSFQETVHKSEGYQNTA